MNNINWYKLKLEVDALLLAFRKAGYQCRKQPKHLAYRLCNGGRDEYVLTYLPAPVEEWTIIPNNDSPIREQLIQLVQSTLDALATVSRPSVSEDYSRPWAIVRLLPNARRYTVARFYNRQDAHDHRKFLARYMPAAEFEVLFDAPTHEQSATCDYQN
ncbi:MAG: hypothetical protein Fur006_69540 [Coleofasciculaceae cyanobacterium]